MPPKTRLRIHPGVSSSQIPTAIRNFVEEKKIVCIWAFFQDYLGENYRVTLPLHNFWDFAVALSKTLTANFETPN